MLRSSLSLALAALAGLAAAGARADDWPQWLGPKRDGVWREGGVVQEFAPGGPKVLWRTPVGQGYAGPAVAGGRVYLTDFVPGKETKLPTSGFARGRFDGRERVLCLDEKTGEVLWKHEYPCAYTISYAAGPRCTPTVDGDRVYTLGAMGHLHCLDAKSGKVLWRYDCVEDLGSVVPLWGFAAHPLIDGDRLICLIGANRSRGKAVVAFDKHTGKEVWSALTVEGEGQQIKGDFGYSPPMIFDVGGTRQLVIWHSESVNGLDPETGKVYWSVPFRVKAALTAPTARSDAGRLFVTSFYNGPMMLKLSGSPPEAEVLWTSKNFDGRGRSEQPQETEKLSSIIATPYFKGDHIYGVDSYGELRCLRADTGERVWTTLKATTDEPTRWGNAFLIKYQDAGDRFFLFNERGELIIADLTPEGYREIGRAKILEPTNRLAGRPVVWMHPAFANKCVIARNDKEVVRVSLEKE